MRKTNKMKRALSLLLAGVTIFSTAATPLTSYAADSSGSSVPLYEDVKDLLDADEVVTAKDYEITVEDDFDINTDLTNIVISDTEKVSVSFVKAEDENGNSFSDKTVGTYEAVYYVQPLTTSHPKYQISRAITVKEADSTGESSDNETASDDKDEGTEDDEESDIVAEETVAVLSLGIAATSEEELSTEGATELTDEEFDAALEDYENQETQDAATGLTLATVLEAAVEEGIALAELDADESVTYTIEVECEEETTILGSLALSSVNSLSVASAASTETVTITRGSWYYYADYGLGTYLTAPYYVSYGSITATAYCVQPSKSGPDDGTYTITKLSDGKTLAKVCYYGTKASGDEGFFEENYPDFSTGKRFIITHIAAAYANGSSDAFSGTNSTGQALALELYEYCVNQPDIPDVAMSFSDDDVTAYVSGSRQRTEVITFEADELQTVTFNLPDGVKLHNTTTGEVSSAGASVTISGGTSFYLSAPLTQAGDVSTTFSTTMKGSITKEYSAYKITTGSSTQDLAFVFGEGVSSEKYISFKVTWLSLVEVTITKKDAETGNVLSGAVYGIYSDAACTELIEEMPATNSKGTSTVTFVKTQSKIYIKEISAPENYYRDTTVYTASCSGSGVIEVAKTFTDQRVNATISLTKEDSETGSTPQGDATLEGAVYGLYAREDIVHPDGTTGVLYKAGTLVTTLTTDKNGKATVSDLYLGNYYIKEITAPVGYNLDENEYDLTCDYEGDLVATVERSCTSKDDVIKQPFQIIKVANNGNTDAQLLSGVGFSVYLISSLTVNDDGSYDFDSATPVVVTADGGTEMFTDETGYACSIALPYGTYIVRETTTPHNFLAVDDFIVTITEHNPTTPQVWRVLLDDEFKAKLKIIKKDDETKQIVLQANTEFKVYDLDNECYVEQVTTYPKTTVHTSYFTDEEGYLILPNNLSPGNYRIEEVTAPYGYTISYNYVEISVDTNMAYLMDSVSGDAIIEVVYENHPVKGELTIIKTGEELVSYDGDFIYEEGTLSGAVYEVYAAEDIYTADFQTDADGNRNVVYAKGDLVATVTTDENGEAVVNALPLGTYEIVEVSAPYGYTLNAVSQTVTFVYADQDTPIIYESVTFTNERQKVAISVEKQDAQTQATVAGAVFGIYNAEDIVNVAGEVIVAADTLLQEMTSDEFGLASCTLDLPLGAYYVKELVAPAGFVSSDEVISFDASYQGQEVETVVLFAVKRNDPTTFAFSKEDITSGAELSGAVLTVFDAEGNVIDSWTSVAGEKHIIQYLVVGETYTLREEFAPYGYLQATDVIFVVEDTAEIQSVVMKDEVPTGTIIINKDGEFVTDITLTEGHWYDFIFNFFRKSLAGVEYEVYAAEDIVSPDGLDTVYHSAGELVATIVTDENGFAIIENLPLGKYYVVETKTVDGFVLDSEPMEADLSYIDQYTEVVYAGMSVTNERQKVQITVVKTDAKTGEALAGATFALFVKEDIYNVDGELVVAADTEVERGVTGEDGTLIFTSDLALGQYYVKELSAPAGYVTSDEVIDIDASYRGADIAVIEFVAEFANEPIKVEISKTDITGEVELGGAELCIIDADGNIVESWTSVAGETHLIERLPVGEYILREITAPYGYRIATDVTFTVTETAEIQTVTMKDDYVTGKIVIVKTDSETGVAIAGVVFEIRDADGNVIETLTTDSNGYAESTELPICTYQEDGSFAENIVYTVVETQAASGYELDETAYTVTFEYDEKEAVDCVVCTLELTNTPVPEYLPQTGDNYHPWLYVGLGMMALLTGAFIAFGGRKKKDEQDKEDEA